MNFIPTVKTRSILGSGHFTDPGWRYSRRSCSS